MEIVAAADSDERGLVLLNIVNVFKSLFTFLKSLLFGSDGEKAIAGDSDSKIDEQITISELEEAAKSIYTMPEITDAECLKKIKTLCSKLVLSNEVLNEICSSLEKELDKGLAKKTHKEANVKCYPTYVRELPNGKECGRFLALDLGGTNFRVLLIELGVDKFKMDSKIFAIPQKIMLGSGEGLFDHIAECLASFIHLRELDSELLPLGFTFSFPCSQEGLTKARLTKWTKGFNCSGVEGEDVVVLLKRALAKRGDVRIKICAILNDTTGTLMSCAWKNQNCRIGLILGTGSNACYMEKLEKVELYEGEKNDEDEDAQVVVNTEWGAFGDNGCLSNVLTPYDMALDKNSLNAGKQLFEKMISGMYMGEIVRHVLVHLTNEGLLFGGNSSDILETKGTFYTKYVSEIEEQESSCTSKSYDILEELGLNHATEADCRNVRYVCEVVSRRAAHLAAAGCAVLINRIKEDRVTVAVDGSVYRFHPHFHNLMVEKISSLIDDGRAFDLMLSEDGSGRGAALVAAVASRKDEHHR